ncbi:VanW family protein [Kineosporia babensis]|uniref:VanW family protein n=1 Tax=Kineosporia babensis TaxID=499548 RepID=A0A9X1T310_9ACTN|nr:VanW family protein [Kineosporia babensis]MCD5315238.1 VanW family protein [Kineosporia babensis]
MPRAAGTAGSAGAGPRENGDSPAQGFAPRPGQNRALPSGRSEGEVGPGRNNPDHGNSGERGSDSDRGRDNGNAAALGAAGFAPAPGGNQRSGAGDRGGDQARPQFDQRADNNGDGSGPEELSWDNPDRNNSNRNGSDYDPSDYDDPEQDRSRGAAAPDSDSRGFADTDWEATEVRPLSSPNSRVSHSGSDPYGSNDSGGNDRSGGSGGTVVPASRIPGGRKSLIIGAAVAGSALAAYLGFAWLESDRVAEGTSVAGVDIGGLNKSEAVNTLNQAFADLDGKIVLTASEGKDEKATPIEDLGLTLNSEAVADRLTGFTVNPVALWKKMAGGGAEEADPSLSDESIEKGLDAFRKNSGEEPKNAKVSFDGTTPKVESSTDGYEIASGAAGVVRSGWLTGEVDVPVQPKTPEISTADAEKVVSEQAEPAVSAPLTVKVGKTEVELSPEQIVPALSFKAKDGELALNVNGKKLRETVLAEGKGISKKPVDAQIVVENGKPKVIPGKDGVTVAAAALAEQVRGPLVATAADQRVAEVPTSAQKPKLTTEKAEGLGVKERISTFSTNLTADAGRTENLRIAAREVDGTLVLPGETFSLNEVLGERTAAKGYNPAPAIQNGRLVQDYGGGVSQMATTIFNNVFFAGLEDVYHKPHSFYISRYPEGREATVNWPTVDLKWKNDTDTAVLIKASASSQVTVSFYGTKYWDITAGKSERSNLRTPETHYDDSDGCVAQSANSGFDVSISRTFRKPGSDKVEKTETFHAVYNAEDTVICGPEPGSGGKKKKNDD